MNRFVRQESLRWLLMLVLVGIGTAVAPHAIAAERATVHFDDPGAEVVKTSGLLVSVNENEASVKPFGKNRKVGEAQVYVIDRATVISGPDGYCNWDDLPDISKGNFVARMEWLAIPGGKRLTVLAVSPYSEEEVEDFNIMEPLPEEGAPAALEALE